VYDSVPVGQTITGAEKSGSAPIRVTVPENVHCPVLPAASVALYVKMVRPVGICVMFVVSGIDTPLRNSLTVTTPTLSVGVTSGSKFSVRAKRGLPSGISPVRLGGHTMAGASLSWIVMANVHCALSPAKSYAVHTTLLLPRGNVTLVNGIEQDT
jgi:hypothetical protein